MSNYTAPALHPKSGRVVKATWIDNYFGPHIYGVSFPGDSDVYRVAECDLEAAAATIERLTAERDEAREVLGPFAKIALWRDSYPDAKKDVLAAYQLQGYIKVDDVRAARAALASQQRTPSGGKP